MANRLLEAGGVGTRNPDARPANNYRGEASIDRGGPERKQNILSRKKENQFGAASALSWNVDRNYSPWHGSHEKRSTIANSE
jgi:hypothetical protein